MANLPKTKFSVKYVEPVLSSIHGNTQKSTKIIIDKDGIKYRFRLSLNNGLIAQCFERDDTNLIVRWNN